MSMTNVLLPYVHRAWHDCSMVAVRLLSFIEALSTACDGNVELQAPLSANSRRGASTHSDAVAKE